MIQYALPKKYHSCFPHSGFYFLRRTCRNTPPNCRNYTTELAEQPLNFEGMRVEVFKTNVRDWKVAQAIVRSIHQAYPTYRANFDLEDCDHILRVASQRDEVHSSSLILFLHRHGYHAEVLREEIQPCKLP